MSKRDELLSAAAEAVHAAQYACIEAEDRYATHPAEDTARDMQNAKRVLSNAEAHLVEVALGEGWQPYCDACGWPLRVPGAPSGATPARVTDDSGDYCAECAEGIAAMGDQL